MFLSHVSEQIGLFKDVSTVDGGHFHSIDKLHLDVTFYMTQKQRFLRMSPNTLIFQRRLELELAHVEQTIIHICMKNCKNQEKELFGLGKGRPLNIRVRDLVGLSL